MLLSHAVAASGCVQCKAGTYSSAGASSCTACPAGTYSSQSGTTTCTPAQEGWYAAGPGAQSQTQCGQGYYSSSTGSAGCTICPPGTYCNSQTNTAPNQCEPGYYSAKAGATQMCTACPVGTFTSIYGATSCCSCCSGYYVDQTAQTHCYNCVPAGYSAPGSTSDSQCTGKSGGLTSCSMSGATCRGSVASQQSVHKREPRPKRCPSGHKSCPLYGLVAGRGYLKGYECVDVEHDLESCGGCAGMYSRSGEHAEDGGRDCSAIPNVADVQCFERRCRIERCQKGYMISPDGQACLSVFHMLAPAGWAKR
ncbi:hypothetical protein B0H21DRAFT_686498 [Amylocystis lapponica]|nr:hypothetical protein B0H21DRAFT_686498 [Amylocystis lapponica]